MRTETPEHITNILTTAMQKVLTSPQAQEYLVSTGGGELMPYGPAQMRKMQIDEVERFREIIKTSGFKPE